MPDQPDRNQQAARDLLRQQQTRPSIRQLILQIIAEAEKQQPVRTPPPKR